MADLDKLCEELRAELKRLDSARVSVQSGKLRAILDDRDRLRKALRGMFCPRPCNRHPDDIEVGLCVDAGECGCGARAALGDAG